MDLNLPKKRVMTANAPAWKRTLSFAIDILIIQFVIFMPYSGVVQRVIPTSRDFTQNYNYIAANPDAINSLIPAFAVMFLLVFAYFVIFELKFGQTPGKMIMRLKLQTEKKERITFLNVAIRNLACFPVFPLWLLWIADPAYLFITGSRLSDRLTKTKIIEEISI
ncbi:TPA: RDD family protein [Candidatus Woesearchaeota archaeon]|nr:hypothetical protein QT06_C0001G0058 [archaeon GW2011_AR15]MBS3104135.1 RDD family protein [Candidatus Woesearchaeota archaeon]HIH41415.1 RDD family protein [Candidatus Woesearchaeota archaeon]